MALPYFGFDGGEGTGKSTAIRLVAEYFGDRVALTREPGGTPEAERIRELLFSKIGKEMTSFQRAEKFWEARVSTIEDFVKPMLAKGKLVLSDRGASSTNVYQGIAEESPELEKYFWAQYRKVLGGCEPVYIIFDIDPKIGLARVDARGGEKTHFDEQDLSYHERVRRGFLDFAADPRITARIVDASQPLDDVVTQVLRAIHEFAPEFS